MSSIKVFRNNEMIFTQTIEHEFHITESPSEELFWYEHSKVNRSGTIKVWLQAVNFAPRLPFILPDWQLIVDDVWFEKKFYEDIEDLKGKTVELQFKEYRFVFQFD